MLGITPQASDKHERQLMRQDLALRRGNYKNAPRSVDLVSYGQVMCLLSEFGTLYTYNKPFFHLQAKKKINELFKFFGAAILTLIHERPRIIPRAADQLKSFLGLDLKHGSRG